MDVYILNLLWIILFSCLSAVSSIDYANYKILAVEAGPDDANQLMSFYKARQIHITTWKLPFEGSTSMLEYMIEDIYVTMSESYLNANDLHYSIVINNVQEYMDHLQQLTRSQDVEPFVLQMGGGEEVSRSGEGYRVVSNDVVGRYATVEQLNSWMMELNETFQDVLELRVIGSTYENRSIYALKIGLESYSEKPAVVIDGGMHAREWVAVSSVVHLIYELLKGYTEADAEVMELLRKVDWYLVPCVNPDGYHYTHQQDRLWRKNRAPTTDSSCIGVDLNRNFPYDWDPPIGSTSDQPCSNVYRGDSAASEPETEALMRLMSHLPLRAYLNVHSFSQQWLYCWAGRDTPCDHEDDMRSLSYQAATAMYRTNDVFYEAGRAHDIIYLISGSSNDWVLGSLGVKYSFGLELRDTGDYGFLLPEEQAMDTGRELWQGVKVVAQQVIQEFPYQPANRDNSDDDITNSGNHIIYTNCHYISLCLVIAVLLLKFFKKFI